MRDFCMGLIIVLFFVLCLFGGHIVRIICGVY
jgi:hypothetical protein